MTEDEAARIAAYVTGAVSMAIVAETLWAIHAARRVWLAYRRRTGESAIFRALAIQDLATAIGGAVVIAIVTLSVGGIRLPVPFGVILIGLVLAIMMWGPISHDRTIRGLSRRRGDGTLPPPYRDGE